MQYVALIYQGSTPLPGSEAWDALSDEDQKQIYKEYGELNNIPGMTPGLPLGVPEHATTGPGSVPPWPGVPGGTPRSCATWKTPATRCTVASCR